MSCKCDMDRGDVVVCIDDSEGLWGPIPGLHKGQNYVVESIFHVGQQYGGYNVVGKSCSLFLSGVPEYHRGRLIPTVRGTFTSTGGIGHVRFRKVYRPNGELEKKLMEKLPLVVI